MCVCVCVCVFLCCSECVSVCVKYVLGGVCGMFGVWMCGVYVCVYVCVVCACSAMRHLRLVECGSHDSGLGLAG